MWLSMKGNCPSVTFLVSCSMSFCPAVEESDQAACCQKHISCRRIENISSVVLTLQSLVSLKIRHLFFYPRWQYMSAKEVCTKPTILETPCASHTRDTDSFSWTDILLFRRIRLWPPYYISTWWNFANDACLSQLGRHGPSGWRPDKYCSLSGSIIIILPIVLRGWHYT